MHTVKLNAKLFIARKSFSTIFNYSAMKKFSKEKLACTTINVDREIRRKFHNRYPELGSKKQFFSIYKNVYRNIRLYFNFNRTKIKQKVDNLFGYHGNGFLLGECGITINNPSTNDTDN